MRNKEFSRIQWSPTPVYSTNLLFVNSKQLKKLTQSPNLKVRKVIFKKHASPEFRTFDGVTYRQETMLIFY